MYIDIYIERERDTYIDVRKQAQAVAGLAGMCSG